MFGQAARRLGRAFALAGLGTACGSYAPSAPLHHARPPRLVSTDGTGSALPVIPPLTGGSPELITAPMVEALHASVVGHYTDASGSRPLPPNGAYVDDPVSVGRVYVVGHNTPSVFAPLRELREGDTVEDRWAGYGDGDGTHDHTTIYRVVRVIPGWPAAYGAPAPAPGASLQLQTCEDTSGQYDRIVDLENVGTT